MRNNLLRLIPYARQHYGMLVVIGVMTLATTAATVAQPWPMKVLVDYALGDVMVPQWLAHSLALLGLSVSPMLLILLAGLISLSLFALNVVLEIGLSWAWMATGQRMVYELAADLFARLQKLSLGYHSRSEVGDKLDRIMTDSWCVYSIVSDLLVSPVQRILTIVGVGVVAWWLDPWLTVLALIVSPVLAASVRYFGPLLKRRARIAREAHARLTSFVHQTVTSIPLVQAFDTERRNQAHFQTLVEDAVAASQKGVLLDKSFALVNGLANTTGMAFVIFAGGQRVLAGDLTVGSLLVFLAYVRTLQGAFRQLLEVYRKFKTSEASLERIIEIMDADDEIREVSNAIKIPRLISSSVGASIEFDGVYFGYAPDQFALRDLSFCVSPGKRIAVVGATGAGKSTLAALIPRFYDPRSGTVSINGCNVRQAHLDSLRSMVAMVAQEPYLLPLTVAETIGFGAPQASRQQIMAAAKAAQAHDFIEQLPRGYDEMIGQRGSTLSGGQKQRLAIARALILDTPIVILDEPTSALDGQTEAELMRAIDNLTANRTTLIIAHRLSTIRTADRILVLVDGKLVESGTHEELIAKCGVYAGFCSVQFGPTQEATA